MIEIATSLSFKTTDSDIEALILESQTIKKLRPQFNIMLRDDKQYFFVNFNNENFLLGREEDIKTRDIAELVAKNMA